MEERKHNLRMILLLARYGLAAAMGSAALSGAMPPVLLHTDLDSGPNSGGENNLGAFVCAYGRHFGATRDGSTVTVGGGEVAEYRTWTNDKICVQLGPGVASGPVVVQTAQGSTAQDIAFTVRAGNIYFVSLTGSDGSNGSLESPWLTPKKCKNSISAGDICYIRGGTYTTFDTNNAILTMNTTAGGAGTPGAPKAIVGYPGEVATLGVFQDSRYAIRGFAAAGNTYSWWTIANLYLRGDTILLFFYDTRFIGNDLECPAGNYGSACLEGSNASRLKIYSNHVHNSGCGETASEPSRTQVSCRSYSVSGTVSSSEATVTSSGTTFSSGLNPRFGSGVSLYRGAIVKVTACGGCGALNEERFVLSKNTSANPHTLTIGDEYGSPQPFSVDLPEGSTVVYRQSSPSKLYHTMYFSTDCNHLEIRWNRVMHNLNAARGLQFHSSPTSSIPAATPTGSNGTVAAAVGGGLSGRTYYTVVTWMGSRGMTLSQSSRSPQVALNVGAGQLLTVTVPTSVAKLTLHDGTEWANARTHFRVYVGDTDGGPFYLQSGDILLGQVWTEPLEGVSLTGPTAPTSSGLSITGYNQHNLYIEGNYFEDIRSTCINLATIAPSKGPVIVRNNVMVRCGQGPSMFDGLPQLSAIEIQANSQYGEPDPGTTPVYVENNTFYRGTASTGLSSPSIAHYMSSGQNQPNMASVIRNNIVFTDGPSRYYYARFSNPAPAAPVCTNNLFYGSDSPLPTDCTATITEDPGFVDADGGDFRLAENSQAVDRGLTIEGLGSDIEGLARPHGAAFDVGAYEYTAGPPLTAGAIEARVSGAVSTALLLRVTRPSGEACTIALNGTKPIPAGRGVMRLLETGLSPRTTYSYTIQCGASSLTQTAPTALLPIPGAAPGSFSFAPPPGLGATRVVIRYGTSAGLLDQSVEATCLGPLCEATAVLASDAVYYAQHEYWNPSARLASEEVHPVLVR